MEVLQPGEKIYIIARRRFDGDLRRHFVGRVEACEAGFVRVRGYAVIYDDTSNKFIRREDERTRILNFGDSGLIVNVIPESVNVDKIEYLNTYEGRLVATDGTSWRLDINEFSGRR